MEDWLFLIRAQPIRKRLLLLLLRVVGQARRGYRGAARGERGALARESRFEGAGHGESPPSIEIERPVFDANSIDGDASIDRGARKRSKLTLVSDARVFQFSRWI